MASIARLYKNLNIKRLDLQTFQLLVEISACDMSQPLSRLDVDWEALLLAIESQGISGIAYYRFYRTRDSVYPPQAFQERLQQYHHYIALQMAEKYQMIKSVLSLLKVRQIDFLVLKGPAIAEACYPEPSLRYFTDLDLLARPADRERIDIALRELGYRLEAGHIDPLPRLIPQTVLDHHTRYEHDQIKFPVEVHWEDILIDDLVPRDLPGMWHRAMPVSIEGVAVKILSLEDHLLHLCAHAHHHRFENLYRVTDLLFILRDRYDQIDWGQFCETVALEEAQVPVYYSFCLVNDLYGVSLPEDLMAQLKPDGLRRWLHERFFAPTFLLIKDQTEEIPFSYKSTPWLKSTMLNLALMSRRREKCHYLLRLMFPTKEWIRQRYQIPADKSLVPYYLLRFFLPAKLMDKMMMK